MPTKAEIKAVASLTDRAEREARGLALIEGPHLAFEALRRGIPTTLYVAEDCRERDALRAAAAAAGARCETVAPEDVLRMADAKTPSGVVGVVRWNAPVGVAALLSAHDALVYFEGVQDPGNVGTIARTAAAFGVGALIFGPGSADPTSAKSLRASAGALLDLPYARDVGVDALLSALRPGGHRAVVAEVRGGVDHRRYAAPARRVLVVSNEGAGTAVPPSASGVDRVTIALAPGAESLNVGAAAAVLLDRLRGG